MSRFSPTSLAMSNWFVEINPLLYPGFYNRGRQNRGAAEQKGCYTVLTVGKCHTQNTIGDTRDVSQTLPALTNSVLSAIGAVHGT